jgi:RimJ/RimL family protein N-acetyltransferase
VVAVGAWDGEELLGGAVLFQYDAAAATVELGSWVTARAEGKGITAACCRALLALARGELMVERIEWRSAPGNLRSRWLAERLGFRFEGTLRSSYVLRGERCDTDVLSLVTCEIDAALESKLAQSRRKL